MNNESLRDRMDDGGSRFFTALAFDAPETRKRTVAGMTPDKDFDLVVGMETMGLPLGVLVAEELGTTFVPMRERGKIPVSEGRVECVDVGYDDRKKFLCVDEEQLRSVNDVLLVDDWIETGTQIVAAIKLLDSVGVNVGGVSVIGVDFNFEEPDCFDDLELFTAI